jgi:hypothetical protein
MLVRAPVIIDALAAMVGPADGTTAITPIGYFAYTVAA